MTPHVKHLIIAGLVVASVLGITWKVIASQDQQAHDKVVLAEHQLQLDQSAQKAAETQAQTDSKAYQALKQQMDVQNAALNGQIALLRASLSDRQARDAALPVPELGERLSELVGAVPGDVKALPDGLSLTTAASRKTVQMLEEVPVSREVIANDEKILTNTKLELASVQTALTSSETALNACKTTAVSADLACKAQISQEKAKGRKRNIIIAIVAAIFGFGARGQI
jgi:hypothetical protein